MQQICSNPATGVRQMAAVLLRKKIAVHWKKQSKNQQEEIKKALMHVCINDTSKPVRRSVAALISSLAKVTVPKKQWAELIDWLLQVSQSADNSHREMSMVLFYNLCENIPKQLRPSFKSVQAAFVRALVDPDDKVRFAALKAMTSLFEGLTEEGDEQSMMSFGETIPNLVEILKFAITKGDEDCALKVIGLIDTFSTCPAPVLDPCLLELVKLFAQICSSAQTDINVRYKASNFIVSTINAKPGKISKAGLLHPLLQLTTELVIAPVEDETEEIHAQTLGYEILDALVRSMKKQDVFSYSMQAASALIAHVDPNKRKGALVILAVLSEGCAEMVAEHLEALLPAVCKCFSDPDKLVRASACVTLTQFSDYLVPEINKYHKVVIPCLIMIIESKEESTAVKRRACMALDSFCDSIDEEIIDYINPIMEKVGGLIATGDNDTRCHAVSVIRSVAMSSKQAFIPYCAATMQMLISFMDQKKDDADLELRARATECAGVVALNCGHEQVKHLLSGLVKLCKENMEELNFFNLREATHTFFSNIIQMLALATPDEILTMALTYIFACCRSDDGLMAGNEDDEDGMDQFNDAQEEDDEEEDERNEKLMIRTGALDEKLSALTAMGIIMNTMGAAYLPYMEKTMESLDELRDYPFPNIRMATIGVQIDIIGLMQKLYPNPQGVKKGEALPLANETKSFLDVIVPNLIERMTEDDDRECAASGCDAVGEVLKLFGGGAIQKPQDLFSALILLTQEKAPCQISEEDDDEEADHSESLIDSYCDLINDCTNMYGEHFEPVFRQLVVNLMKYAKAHRPDSYRSLVIGCIAEALESMGPVTQTYAKSLFPQFLQLLQDPAINVRRNAVFGCGVLCQVGKDAAHPFYEQTLHLLSPLLTIPEGKGNDIEYTGAKDNAASCLGKMIVCHPQGMPLDKAIPIFVNNLPFLGDPLEGKHAYPALLHMYSLAPQIMTPLTPQVIDILTKIMVARIVDKSEVPSDEVMAQIRQFLKALFGSSQQAVTQVLQGLSQQQQEAFQKLVLAA